MSIVKEFIRKWLGIQHLSNYIVLTRKELGLPENIPTLYDMKMKDVKLANQYKGRDWSSTDDMWPEKSAQQTTEVPKPDVIKGYKNGEL